MLFLWVSKNPVYFAKEAEVWELAKVVSVVQRSDTILGDAAQTSN